MDDHCGYTIWRDTSDYDERQKGASSKTLGESPQGFPTGKFGPGSKVSCVGGWDHALITQDQSRQVLGVSAQHARD